MKVDFGLPLFIYCLFVSIYTQCINQLQISSFNHCSLCSYEYHNSNFDLNTSFQSQNCSKKTSIAVFRTILIVNQVISSLNIMNSTMFDAVYDDLLKAFVNEENFLSNSLKGQLIVYFSKGDHFVLSLSSKTSFFTVLLSFPV